MFFAKAHLLEGEALLLYPLHSTIPCMTFEFALYHNIVLYQMKNKHISLLHIFSDQKKKVRNVSCQSMGTSKLKSKFLTPKHEKNSKCKKKNNLSFFYTYKNHLNTSITVFYDSHKKYGVYTYVT